MKNAPHNVASTEGRKKRPTIAEARLEGAKMMEEALKAVPYRCTWTDVFKAIDGVLFDLQKKAGR